MEINVPNGAIDKGGVRLDVKRESQKYNDIILVNFTDNFHNLPIKVSMAFEWALGFCKFEYLLKSDDDVFLHIPNIYQFLGRKNIPKTRLYAGNVHGDKVPGSANSLTVH